MTRPMPIPVYMLFAYFSGVFASAEKTHWTMWLLPLLPMVMLIPLQIMWNWKPVQRTLNEWYKKGST